MTSNTYSSGSPTAPNVQYSGRGVASPRKYAKQQLFAGATQSRLDAGTDREARKRFQFESFPRLRCRRFVRASQTDGPGKGSQPGIRAPARSCASSSHKCACESGREDDGRGHQPARCVYGRVLFWGSVGNLKEFLVLASAAFQCIRSVDFVLSVG